MQYLIGRKCDNSIPKEYFGSRNPDDSSEVIPTLFLNTGLYVTEPNYT